MPTRDYGIKDGYLIEPGSTPPEGHVAIRNQNGLYAVPVGVVDEEYANYSSTLGSPRLPNNPAVVGNALGMAKNVLNVAGISKVADDTTTEVGVDFRGDPVYSDKLLANSKDTSFAKNMATSSGIALGAMGAFKDFNEASRFLDISNRAVNPAVIEKLDTLKVGKDPKGFINEIGGNKNLTEFTGYKLYENWNNLSPAQKSIALAGTEIQGFTFDDGQTFAKKQITPAIPGVPSMNAAEGLKIAVSGVNVAPAARKWNQYSAIQETFSSPKTATDVVATAQQLGILGQGTDGRAVPIDENIMAQQGMQPTPHYGVGAATIPANQGLPTGYVAAGQINGRTIVVPAANRGSAVINAPDVASDAAGKIYRTWKSDGPVNQERGAVGGSALAGGLDGMSSTNPYSAGAIVTLASLANTPPPADYGDMETMSYITGVSLHRLANGNANYDDRGKDLVRSGGFTEDNFGKNMKEHRAEYAKQGISSKEVGYQLANQGYAEGRFDESQLVALHRSLDMVFDANGYQLAQKLSTGKNKGLEILERRRAK